MKAIVLVDNIAQENMNGEWGLCIYIEQGDRKILLDTGASNLFLTNAEKLGVQIADVDHAVLSHAHYDHADGMRAFFAQNKKASFTLQKGSGENCYAKKWIFHKYIGIPKGILTEEHARITWAQGDYELCPGAWIIPHKTPGLGEIGRRNSMYIRTGQGLHSGWQPDDFAHEQSLVIETAGGLVIFNSCSHGGADNIIQEIQATYPGQKIRALIGGFHIFNRTEEEVRDLARRIKETGVQEIYTGHCTGKHSYHVLKEELGDMAHQLKVGLVIEM